MYAHLTFICLFRRCRVRGRDRSPGERQETLPVMENGRGNGEDGEYDGGGRIMLGGVVAKITGMPPRPDRRTVMAKSLRPVVCVRVCVCMGLNIYRYK